jgi:hypothetical protein
MSKKLKTAKTKNKLKCSQVNISCLSVYAMIAKE